MAASSAVALPLIGEVPPQASRTQRPVAIVDLCAELADAIDATGQRKEAAIAMDIAAPVLTKQLARVDGAAPRLDRMGHLKRETLVDFAHRILAACQADDAGAARREAVQGAARALGQLVAMLMEVSR